MSLARRTSGLPHALTQVRRHENARLYTEAQRNADERQKEIAERKQAEEERALMLIREQLARAEAEQATVPRMNSRHALT